MSLAVSLWLQAEQECGIRESSLRIFGTRAEPVRTQANIENP